MGTGSARCNEIGILHKVQKMNLCAAFAEFQRSSTNCYLARLESNSECSLFQHFRDERQHLPAAEISTAECMVSCFLENVCSALHGRELATCGRSATFASYFGTARRVALKTLRWVPPVPRPFSLWSNLISGRMQAYERLQRNGHPSFQWISLSFCRSHRCGNAQSSRC